MHNGKTEIIILTQSEDCGKNKNQINCISFAYLLSSRRKPDRYNKVSARPKFGIVVAEKRSTTSAFIPRNKVMHNGKTEIIILTQSEDCGKNKNQINCISFAYLLSSRRKPDRYNKVSARPEFRIPHSEFRIPNYSNVFPSAVSSFVRKMT